MEIFRKGDKNRFTQNVIKIAGVYVPSFYEITYHSQENRKNYTEEGPEK